MLVQLLSWDGRGDLGLEVEIDDVEHSSGSQADLGIEGGALPCDFGRGRLSRLRRHLLVPRCGGEVVFMLARVGNRIPTEDDEVAFIVDL